MAERDNVLKTVRAAFERDRRINLHRHPIAMDFEDGALTLEGEVESIAAKKLALEIAIAVPGVSGIVDRLHVEPAERMTDGAILDAVRNTLLQEPALENCSIRVKDKRRVETVREARYERHSDMEISVTDGVVLLDDHVLNLSQKRLAEVLAWWVPGSRDVVNGLEVSPPQEDSDDEVTDAVRLVLEKHPFVNAGQILVSTRDFVVTLDGVVRSPGQKQMAEHDAWYVYGVDNVINRIEVRP